MAKVVSNRSSSKPKKKKRCLVRKKREHQKFGTSKLEQDFAKDFLDKLDVDYEWQKEAKDIGRFYDYAIYPKNGGIILVEIDGSYYHADPRVVDEGKLTPMQKRNKRVDEYKNNWALMHGIPIIRIWEKDIRENPAEVMKMLKERLYIKEDNEKKKNEKNKRHKNKLNQDKQ